MPFVVTTAPASEPVTLAELKTFLRVDSTSEDALLTSLIVAAREQIDGLTRRPMINQTVAATFADWPADSEIILPVGGVSSVTSLKYYNAANSLTTVTSTLYQLVANLQPGRIVLLDAFTSPEVFDRPDAVVVTVVAGYGATVGYVPESLKLAVKHLASYWFEQRLPVNVGNIVNEMPRHVGSIIAKYRVIAPEL